MHNGNRSAGLSDDLKPTCKLGNCATKKLALQVQPFQVLAILLKNSGSLVTREQLQSQVWPKDTFVDFDHALNTAITKIRLALGDNAEQPTFIETLPRRGYRFIGPMDRQIQTKSASKSKQHLERLRAPKILTALGVTLVVLLCSGTRRSREIFRYRR